MLHWRTPAGKKRKHYIMSQEYYHFTVNTPTQSIGVGCDEGSWRILWKQQCVLIEEEILFGAGGGVAIFVK